MKIVKLEELMNNSSQLSNVEIKRPIYLKYWIDNGIRIEEVNNTRIVENFDDLQVVLVAKNYRRSGYDLIYVQYENIDCLYLGQWNDGVI